MASSEGSRGWLKDTKETLNELVRKINAAPDCQSAEDQAELEQLRLRSAKVNELQQENAQLRSQLETALKDLGKRKRPSSAVIPASDDEDSEEPSPAARRTNESKPNTADVESSPKRSTRELFKEFHTRDAAVQTELEPAEDEFPASVPSSWSDKRAVRKYNELVPKYRDLRQDHTALKTKYKELQEEHDKMEGRSKILLKNHEGISAARDLMETKIRKLKETISGWQYFTNGLQKRNKKLMAQLNSRSSGDSVGSKSRSPRLPRNKSSRGSGNDTPALPSSDDEYLRPPSPISSSPRGPPAMITPVSALFNPRLRSLRTSRASSPISETSSVVQTSNRINQLRLQADQNDEHQSLPPQQMPVVQIDFPVLPNDDNAFADSPPSEILEAPLDQIFEDEEFAPAGQDENEQELPELPVGDGTVAAEESPHTSSTQGEPYPTQQPVPVADSPIVKLEGSSPVLVHARRLAKPNSRRRNATNTETTPVAKVEEISSSPVGLGPSYNGDSMDLDDHPHMVTPKKRRAPPASYRASSSRLSISVNPADNETITTPHEVTASREILVERSPDKPSRRSNVLQPSNVNKKLLPRDGEPPRKRRCKEASAREIASLAEDGENFQEFASESRGSKKKSGLGPLHDLLENPPPKDPPRLPKSAQLRVMTPRTSPRRPRNSRGGSNPRDVRFGSLSVSRLNKLPTSPKIASSGDIYDPPSSSPRDEVQTVTKFKASKPAKKKTPARRSDSPVDDEPENEPLRCRPIASLRLDDFKVNPSFNQGYEYAFSDVVRGNARKCLPGCERECCGPQFRKLAEMTISSRFGPPTKAIQESDKKALMSYLGDNYVTYARYSEAQKRETLILAMARQLANDHGKHRYSYLRQASPPGFWDVDFPATQEMKANREAAAKMLRQQIEERYREAMRPGGRFIFRDE